MPSLPDPRGVISPWRKRLDSVSYRASLHAHNLGALPPAQRLRYLRQKAARLWPQPLPELIRAVQQANQRAASAYIPAPYAGPITLFRATHQPPWLTPDPALGWRAFAHGEITIYDTPGHHADLVRDPRARILPRQLTEALAHAQSLTAPARCIVSLPA